MQKRTYYAMLYKLLEIYSSHTRELDAHMESLAM